MARRHRFHLQGATYHVMLRGNDGQKIFFSDGDKSRMCLLIQQGIERFGHVILAFCFMTNHIHLAIQVGDVSISRIMQNLAFRYTQHINQKQKHKGHLFQGRFKSILVDESEYLKELIRYIHLNPVHARLTSHPEKYLWSSHRAFMQLSAFAWLNPEIVVNRFDHNHHQAIVNYEDYVLRGIGIESEIDFKSGFKDGILSNESFADKIVKKVGRTLLCKIELTDLVELVCNHYHMTIDELGKQSKHAKQSHVRSVLALLVREFDGISLEKLGILLNRGASGLSKLAARLEIKSKKSETIANEVNQLRQLILAKSRMSECQA